MIIIIIIIITHTSETYSHNQNLFTQPKLTHTNLTYSTKITSSSLKIFNTTHSTLTFSNNLTLFTQYTTLLTEPIPTNITYTTTSIP